MADSALWRLQMQTKRVRSARDESVGLWRDSAYKQVATRHLDPHEQEAGRLTDHLEQQVAAVDDSEQHLSSVSVHGTAAFRHTQAFDVEVERSERELAGSRELVGQATHYEDNARATLKESLDLLRAASRPCHGIPDEYGDPASAFSLYQARPHSTQRGGLNFLDPTDLAGRYAELADPLKGYQDVIVHSDGASFEAEGEMDLNASELAEAIEQSSSFEKGSNIRLLACKAGQGQDSLAQQLTDELQVPVLAATDTVWASPDGRLTVGPTPYQPTGGWKRFKPRTLT